MYSDNQQWFKSPSEMDFSELYKSNERESTSSSDEYEHSQNLIIPFSEEDEKKEEQEANAQRAPMEHLQNNNENPQGNVPNYVEIQNEENFEDPFALEFDDFDFEPTEQLVPGPAQGNDAENQYNDIQENAHLIGSQPVNNAYNQGPSEDLAPGLAQGPSQDFGHQISPRVAPGPARHAPRLPHAPVHRHRLPGTFHSSDISNAPGFSQRPASGHTNGLSQHQGHDLWQRNSCSPLESVNLQQFAKQQKVQQTASMKSHAHVPQQQFQQRQQYQQQYQHNGGGYGQVPFCASLPQNYLGHQDWNLNQVQDPRQSQNYGWSSANQVDDAPVLNENLPPQRNPEGLPLQRGKMLNMTTSQRNVLERIGIKVANDKPSPRFFPYPTQNRPRVPFPSPTAHTPAKLSNVPLPIEPYTPEYGLSYSVDTSEVVRVLNANMDKYNLSQKEFAKIVLGRGQSTLSDVLRAPLPWNQLNNGREMYVRMVWWLQMTPEDKGATKSLKNAQTFNEMYGWPPATAPPKKTHGQSTRLNPLVREELLQYFQGCTHPNGEQMHQLAVHYGLREATINNFFSNQRRNVSRAKKVENLRNF